MSATILMVTYPNDGRKLQRLIIGILKQHLAISINRINYVKTYTLHEGKITRTEEKILLIRTSENKKEQLTAFIKKQHPNETLAYVRLNPSDIDQIEQTHKTTKVQ